jgi:hypothetical protein
MKIVNANRQTYRVMSNPTNKLVVEFDVEINDIDNNTTDRVVKQAIISETSDVPFDQIYDLVLAAIEQYEQEESAR